MKRIPPDAGSRHLPVQRRHIRAALEAGASNGEDQPWMTALSAEIEADRQMARDDRYAVLLGAARERFGQRKLQRIIDHPEKIVSQPYPLYVTEVAPLMKFMGIEVGAKTIERMVEAGVVPTPPTIGAGRHVRTAFFARHVIDVLFALEFFQRPVVTEAWLAVLRGELQPTVATYLRGLPSVRVEALDLLSGAAR